MVFLSHWAACSEARSWDVLNLQTATEKVVTRVNFWFHEPEVIKLSRCTSPAKSIQADGPFLRQAVLKERPRRHGDMGSRLEISGRMIGKP